MIVVAICSLMLASPVRDYNDGMATCLAIGSAAHAENEPLHVIIALAYEESRMRFSAVSPKGAIGPMQVMPYWLEDSCGEIDAGIIAWQFWRSRSVTIRDAIAKYNAGYKPGKRSFRFADRVLGIADELVALASGVSSVD